MLGLRVWQQLPRRADGRREQEQELHAGFGITTLPVTPQMRHFIERAEGGHQPLPRSGWAARGSLSSGRHRAEAPAEVHRGLQHGAPQVLAQRREGGDELILLARGEGSQVPPQPPEEFPTRGARGLLPRGRPARTDGQELRTKAGAQGLRQRAAPPLRAGQAVKQPAEPLLRVRHAGRGRAAATSVGPTRPEALCMAWLCGGPRRAGGT
mmetsp:Transcript_102978/g.317719  ORF Transcript_102978/g.317719 Transcript_102978/m.317719 type:complete len:210 (-) Transcript_102978:17-646(-)